MIRKPKVGNTPSYAGKYLQQGNYVASVRVIVNIIKADYEAEIRKLEKRRNDISYEEYSLARAEIDNKLKAQVADIHSLVDSELTSLTETMEELLLRLSGE